MSSEEDSQSLHLENNTETELASEDGKVTNQVKGVPINISQWPAAGYWVY